LVAPQGSLELRALAKQVQAIISKLGALQAHIQRTSKSYASAAAGPPQNQVAALPKAPCEPSTRACLVLHQENCQNSDDV
jgi:hypothetical protein